MGQKSKSDSATTLVTNGDERSAPLLPIRNVVAFPGSVIPIQVERETHIAAVEEAINSGGVIVLGFQDAPDLEPSSDTLLPVGVYAEVLHSVKLSTGEYRLRLHVQGRAEILKYIQEKPFILVEMRAQLESRALELSAEEQRIVEEVKSNFAFFCSFDDALEDHLFAVEQVFHPGVLADLVASALPLRFDEAETILSELDGPDRLRIVDEMLGQALDKAALRERISDRVSKEMKRSEYELLLREQLKQIRAELGEEESEGADQDVRELRERFKTEKFPERVQKEGERQLRRLQQLHPETAEAALTRTYLDWIVEVPWVEKSKNVLSLKKARKILDEDHFGLDETKERVLDYLGVRKLKKDLQGPVLLLVGPPGVGKTSLGQSIARSLGRKFVRVALGGLRDEAELRGHRRTYVGAMPGRIIQGLKNAGTKNPVFMLDEIDKVGADFRGDPASVLLEILDPEQNSSFEDYYLNLPFDLSEVMFIATANRTDTIPSALKDRMEMIEISGYTNEEKTEIARRYLIPKSLESHGLADYKISYSSAAIKELITGFTRESGVRELGRVIDAVSRKIARGIAEDGKAPKSVTPKLVEKILGPKKFIKSPAMKTNQIGVSTGLAWTPVGGELLMIEVSKTRGKGDLSLTGQMGEVMRESAQAALTYVLENAKNLGIKEDFFDGSNIHIHVPQGAIPKDGPSAGVAITSALVSLLSGRPVSHNVAMTGEVTLRGNVLAVGGVKEKALAAMRAEISVVVIPKENERELATFPQYLLDNVKFVAVEHIDEVLDVVLLKQKKARKPRTAKGEVVVKI